MGDSLTRMPPVPRAGQNLKAPNLDGVGGRASTVKRRDAVNFCQPGATRRAVHLPKSVSSPCLQGDEHNERLQFVSA